MKLLTSLFCALLASGALDTYAEEVRFPDASEQAVLVAEWFPVTTSTKQPVIIALHGCSGLRDAQGRFNTNVYRDAAYFNAEGIAYLAVDSFTLRGISSICEIPASRRPIDEQRRSEDVMAAMHWLSLQPGVDMERVAVLGRSHGAQTVLSLLDQSVRRQQPRTHQVKAAIALYPGCNKFLKQPNYQINTPLLLLVGESDDWTPAVHCVHLAQRLKQERPSTTLEFHVYPDSYHGFDSLNPPRVRAGVASTKSGTATVGGNPAAREDTYRRIFEFLSVEFSQPLHMSHELRSQLKPLKR